VLNLIFFFNCKFILVVSAAHVLTNGCNLQGLMVTAQLLVCNTNKMDIININYLFLILLLYLLILII